MTLHRTVFIGLLLSGALLLQSCAGLGIATATAVVLYYENQSFETASVEIDRPADKVFDKAIAILKDNSKIKIDDIDTANKTATFTKEGRKAKLVVIAKEKHQSLIEVSAEKSDNHPAKETEKAILKFCTELNVQCEASSK